MKNYEFLAEALLASRGRYDDLAYVARLYRLSERERL